MNDPVTEPETVGPPAPGRGRTPVRIAVIVVIAVAVVAASVLLGYRLAAPGTPADDSPEAGFARDMQTHHNQAVQMAFIIRSKTDDPTLQAMSYDIITTQQQQSGQMYAWLVLWGLPQTSSQPPMAWMTQKQDGGMSRHNPAPSQTGRMPGMASPAQIAELKESSGQQAEILFLELMIEHHEAGIDMAEAIQTQTDRPEVLTLANAIATAQTAEIKQLAKLLQNRQP